MSESPTQHRLDGPILTMIMYIQLNLLSSRYSYIHTSLCWNCFSPLRRGAPTEATPQQRRWQQRHSNGNGKGILVTTAWHSSIAASFVFFLLDCNILLHSRKKILVTSTSSDFITRQQSNHLVLSLSLFSLSFSVLVKTLKRKR